jgi:uncharacterized repeat protein (TIGR04076 family)
MPANQSHSDAFELYDLRIEVVGCQPGKRLVCNHPIGSYFEVSGEELTLPAGQSFPIYPLAALLPLIPAKQRATDPHDWMTTDTLIACPDPNCGGLFEIKRVRQRTFYHGEVTVTPLEEDRDA